MIAPNGAYRYNNPLSKSAKALTNHKIQKSRTCLGCERHKPQIPLVAKLSGIWGFSLSSVLHWIPNNNIKNNVVS